MRRRSSNARLRQKNRELAALLQAALDFHRDLDLESVLANVVKQARSILGAKYGALSVYDEDGSTREFLTSGLSSKKRRAIGRPPSSKGILGVALHQSESLRIRDVRRDPRFTGFPANHPQIRSLLVVPIRCRCPFQGTLYLADKESEIEFSDADETTLSDFARTAEVAIDNAHIHARLRALAVVEERARIADETHEELVQILAYVNFQSQAVAEYIRRGDHGESERQLKLLSQAARDIHTDAREALLALRVGGSPDRSFASSLREFVATWQAQTGIRVDLAIEEGMALRPDVGIQLHRMVQQLLSNARKRSPDGDLRLELRRSEADLTVTVLNEATSPVDGSGSDEEAHLERIQERARMIGASVDVEPTPGLGTTTTIRVPLAARSAES